MVVRLNHSSPLPRRAALIGYIAEQQAKGLTYDEAWARAKVERAILFEQTARK